MSSTSKLADVIQNTDWLAHPLGPLLHWPATLRATLDILLNSELSMFLVWGPDRFFFYNDAYTSALRPGVTGVIGSTMAEFRTGEAENVHMAVESAFAGRTSRLTDVAVVPTRDGRHERNLWTASYLPIFDETGSVAGVLSFSVKTTACVADADRLRGSEVRDRQIIDSVTESAIIATDIDGRVTRWNEGAHRLLGWSETEMSGELIHRCFTPEDVARGVADLEMQRAFHDGSFPDNRWHQRKDGSRFWGSGEMTVLRDSSGKAAGFVKVFRDRTRQWSEEEALRSAQRQADRALRQAEEQLRHLQKIEAVGRLTGGVAHDFNNLLTVICSSVDFLKRPDATEAQRFRCITAITDAAERGAKLTGQLLAFARRQDLKHEVFAVGDNIRKLKEMLGTLIGAGIEIVTSDLEAPCFVSADPNQFDTALVNMVVNARDAMDSAGQLTFRICSVDSVPPVRGQERVSGAFVAVSVTDTGAGISPGDHERIFEPFFTTKEIGSGTGLGLSQVFGFAKQSNGEVVVESQVGKGASFTLYLPRVAPLPATPDA